MLTTGLIRLPMKNKYSLTELTFEAEDIEKIQTNLKENQAFIFAKRGDDFEDEISYVVVTKDENNECDDINDIQDYLTPDSKIITEAPKTVSFTVSGKSIIDPKGKSHKVYRYSDEEVCSKKINGKKDEAYYLSDNTAKVMHEK